MPTSFPIYRAEPLTASLRAGERQTPRTTVRLPSNVPYFVDNLWEYLRPEYMPSRRHAIYASPTRELARRNCSGKDQGLGLCVYRLVVDGSARLAHLKVTDARHHDDLKTLPPLAQKFGQDLVNAGPEEKPFLALLFLPGAARVDLERARENSPTAKRILDAAAGASTFWREASAEPSASNHGELFLQLESGSSYAPAEMEVYR